MSIALYLGIPIALVLGYIAIAGRVYRATRPAWHVDDARLASAFWPFTVLCLSAYRLGLFFWRLGANKREPKPKLPRAEVRR